MIKTLSLCPTCYAKIPAEISFQNGMAVMTKTCDVHGPFTSIVEKDIQHVSNFYHRGTLGNNNTIIIHTHNACNMSCPWCYYPMGQEKIKDFAYFDEVLQPYKGNFNLLMSGGEPTIAPNFFQFVEEADINGWGVSAITNMLQLSNPDFFRQAIQTPALSQGNMLRFAMSMQHPKNYSDAILCQKMKAMEHLEYVNMQAMCAMFSITSLDELDFIRTWYDATKRFYPMLRIRTMFRNWANKGDDNHIWLSDLHKAFLSKFADLHPRISERVEKSNMYCLYLEMDGGMQVSLSSAPTVENIDYNICARPVFMLADNARVYSVPTTMIVNEGIASGWMDGYRIGGGVCG